MFIKMVNTPDGSNQFWYTKHWNWAIILTGEGGPSPVTISIKNMRVFILNFPSEFKIRDFFFDKIKPRLFYLNPSLVPESQCMHNTQRWSFLQYPIYSWNGSHPSHSNMTISEDEIWPLKSWTSIGAIFILRKDYR